MTKLAALVLLSVSIGAAQMKLDDPNKQVKGTLAPVNGGTGQNTFTKGDILCALSSSALSKLNVGSNGKVLTASSSATCGVEWDNPAGTGTVTSVACGTGLNCTTITSSGTINVATPNLRRVCMLQVGDGTNTVASGDYSPFKTGRCYIPYAATVVEVLVQSDAGTPSVQIQKRHGASTVTSLLSGALAAAGTTKTCALTSTSGTCIDGTTSSGSITISTTSIAAGDYIEVASGTASTEKSTTIAVTFTVN